MPTELAKQYDPHEAQKQWLQFWEQRGYFHSRPDPNREMFSIVIPPPNVTGALHLGHALNNTLQDVLIRWRRMQGFNALWMPGTDHAGIATQAVVERRIRDEEGKTRHDLGREELVKRIWQWKDQYEKRILDQLRQLGASCDWARTRFTLDPICARAVRQTFFGFFRDKLIFRGKRLVNWDTHLQTAVADDEIFHDTVKGGFWTFRYPVKSAVAKSVESTAPVRIQFGTTAVTVIQDVTSSGPSQIIVTGSSTTWVDAGPTLAAVPGTDSVFVSPLREGPRDPVRIRLNVESNPIPKNDAEQASSGALESKQEAVCAQTDVSRLISSMPSDSSSPAHRFDRRSSIIHKDASERTEFIRFSTTRPETMLGDTAVAVHPDDERYKHLIGKMVTIPLVGRDIPIIGDADLVDPKLGTGAVKVTPAHDANDYACGLRQKLPMINILNANGTINENGGRFAGLDRYVAREKVTEEMEKLGLFDGREDRDIELAHSDRSKTPIEPYLSDQWFVKMADLAQTAMDAVFPSPSEGRRGGGEGNRVEFFPPRYAKTYLDWLGEKRDWCISRQLWWGHRIPVWSKVVSWTNALVNQPLLQFAEIPVNTTGSTVWSGQVLKPEYRDFAADQSRIIPEEDKLELLICVAPGHEDFERQLETAGFQQDPDVLDTWFSSALWPHSTMGWPEMTPDLAYYYPTSVLITSRDIITLWVARMVITGLYNMKKVPFHHVYIHPKILDGFGETMSKSKGNGIDPLDIIHRYGTDALRYGMVNLATETQDSRMPVANVCPHCDKLVPMKQEHMYMRTKKLTCPECKKPFRPGGPWPTDSELPTAKQASERFELGRNFANKIWNAARFILRNLEGYAPEAVALQQLPIEDRWILSRLATTTKDVTAQLEGYHFAEYARTVYEFIWSEFCDWYIEMSKDRLRDAAGDRASAQRVLVGILDGILRLIQPIMPFVAESIWQALNEIAFERGLPSPEPAAESVVIAAWPHYPEDWQDAGTEQRIAHMQELVRAVRETRNRYTVDPKRALDVFVKCHAALADDFRSLEPFIKTLGGVGRLEIGSEVHKPPQAASHVTPEFEVYISLAGLIDVAAEMKRLEKQLAEKRKFLQSTRAKLDNESFVKGAPAEVVQQQRDLVADLQKQIETMERNLRELGG